MGTLQDNIFVHLNRNKADIFIGILLFLCFFSLYFSQSQHITHAACYKRFDTLFDADQHRVLDDLAHFNGNHYRTNLHPLFVIILNPIGTALHLLLPDLTVALVLTAIAGSIVVFLVFQILRILGMSRFLSILFALMTGLSSSYSFTSSLPETYAFSAAAMLLVLYISFYTKDQRQFFLRALLPCVIAFGFSTTNLAWISLVAFYKLQAKGHRLLKKITLSMVSAGAFIILVLLVAAVGAVVQKAIYPSSTEFFLKEAYSGDVNNFGLEIITRPGNFWFRTSSMLTYNIVAPVVSAYDKILWLPVLPSASTFFSIAYPLDRPLQLATLALYSCIVLFSLYLLVKNRLYRHPLALMLAGNVFVVTIFFFFYGGVVFLYSPLVTWSLILLLAYPFTYIGKEATLLKYCAISLLVVFCALLAVCNHMFILEVVAKCNL